MTDQSEDGALSPFHQGEQEIQTRVGKREVMERFGSRVIRSFLPEQHREFYQQLPYILLGSVDSRGWPWASILSGGPGFIQTPDAATLLIQAKPIHGDVLDENIKVNSALGLLGIDLATRRRNRVNARVSSRSESQFSIKVDQSFGNCPQYIQRRKLEYCVEPQACNDQQKICLMEKLDDAACEQIRAADTFFVSSFIPVNNQSEIEGVDVSHRGGNPGFVKLEGNTLTIPDFSGNNHFNTLGNFLLNPKAGLLFIDFDSRDILQLTGTVELLWEDDPEISAFKGAERGWRFTVMEVRRLEQALPFRTNLAEPSLNSLHTGNWQQADSVRAATELSHHWRKFQVARIEDESLNVRSFYLQPADGMGLVPNRAGQYIGIRLSPDMKHALSAQGPRQHVRHYTVSSAPGDLFYRISVKREDEGVVSSYLHKTFAKGSTVDVKAPAGDFYIDPDVLRPAVLLAGGVGITPMISMAEHVLAEGQRTRYLRPLTIIHASHSTLQRAFAKDLHRIARQSSDQIRYYSFISNPEPGELTRVDFYQTGHISRAAIQAILPINDYDFYLCGPAGFMQAMYDMLLSLGADDNRIHAESFGVASLIRKVNKAASSQPPAEAESAVLKFSESAFEQRWSKGDATLLEVAEQHGLTPDFSCREGNCGACATVLTSGEVSYRKAPTAPHADNEVLICCAVPAKGSDELVLKL